MTPAGPGTTAAGTIASAQVGSAINTLLCMPFGR